MYKEKLQKKIAERFINEKIDIDKFIRLSEKVEKISETKAKKILKESVGKIALGTAGAATGGLFGLAIWRALKLKKMTADSDYKKCIQQVKNTLGKKYEKIISQYKRFNPAEKRSPKAMEFAKKAGKMEQDYQDAIFNCEKLYDQRIKAINTKKKEVRMKYKAMNAKMKKRREE